MRNRIRIFLSSTFKDMRKERDYLVRKIFPALRTISEERGVPFSWCDLRFGVSSFEDEYIIRLCLRNLEDCFPCFVGLLGGSYGSIPRNLNNEQIRRLSVFQGVPSMIKKQYGYTEIEMRFCISLKDECGSFDFYFFLNEFDLNKGIVYDLKCFLKHPIDSISLLWKNAKKDRLYSWKKYILKNSGHTAPCYWFFDEYESVSDNIIYNSLRNRLENMFPVLQHPKEELLWNEQQTYMQSIVLEAFSLDNLEKEACYDRATDILNLYSSKATGKTFYVANCLQKAMDSGIACFYYFIGVSRGLDTPLNIWRGILYQVCKFLDVDYSLYKHINDMVGLRHVLTQLIHQISQGVLIAIDGFCDDVICSLEQYNTFVSDFPDPKYNIKYILSSSHKLPKTNRITSIEHRAGNYIIKRYIEKYLNSYYGYSVHNQQISVLNYPKDLREARHSIDETIITSGAFMCKDSSLKSDLYGSIKNRILNNIYSQSNYYEGDKQSFIDTIMKSINYISLTKYGFLESDICNICNVNAEQWTIIYSYLSQFFKSKGCIKLQESVAKQFSIIEDVDVLRNQLIERLQIIKNPSQYTKEILYQASMLNSKSLLCEILSDIETLIDMYEIDKDLLTKYLVVIDRACLLKDFVDLLDVSLNIITGVPLLSKLLKIITIFYAVLPRYAVVLHYIKIIGSYIEKNPVSIECQLEYNSYIINAFIIVGKFDEASELLELSDRIIKENTIDAVVHKQYIIKNLFLKAKLYDSDLREPSENCKALDFYKELIDKYQQNLETDDFLRILDRYIMLKKEGEDVENYVSVFASVLSNRITIKDRSRLFIKYEIMKYIHKLVLNRFEPESKELDIWFSKVFSTLEEFFQMYPYSQDNLSNLFYIIEIMFVRINKLKAKNLYGTSCDFTYLLRQWVDKFATLSKMVYGTEYGYAIALFESARFYDELAFICPLEKDNYISKSIELSIEAENLFNSFFQRDNILIIAKLNHNRANSYRQTRNFECAILCINKAINLKTELLSPNDKSLYDSKIRRVSLLVEMIVFTENLDFVIKEIELCQCYLSELKSEVLNETTLSEQEKKGRIIEIDDLEKRIDLYIKNPKERFLEVAKIKFEEFKRSAVELKHTINKITLYELSNVLNKLYNKKQVLDSYLDNHALYQVFNERCIEYKKYLELLNLLAELRDSRCVTDANHAFYASNQLDF